MNKMCWWCKYFYYSNGGRGYSELTPGWDTSMNCLKGYWEHDQFSTSQKEFIANLTKAKSCKDWTPIDEWKKNR